MGGRALALPAAGRRWAQRDAGAHGAAAGGVVGGSHPATCQPLCAAPSCCVFSPCCPALPFFLSSRQMVARLEKQLVASVGVGLTGRDVYSPKDPPPSPAEMEQQIQPRDRAPRPPIPPEGEGGRNSSSISSSGGRGSGRKLASLQPKLLLRRNATALAGGTYMRPTEVGAGWERWPGCGSWVPVLAYKVVLLPLALRPLPLPLPLTHACCCLWCGQAATSRPTPFAHGHHWRTPIPIACLVNYLLLPLLAYLLAYLAASSDLLLPPAAANRSQSSLPLPTLPTSWPPSMPLARPQRTACPPTTCGLCVCCTSLAWLAAPRRSWRWRRGMGWGGACRGWCWRP